MTYHQQASSKVFARMAAGIALLVITVCTGRNALAMDPHEIAAAQEAFAEAAKNGHYVVQTKTTIAGPHSMEYEGSITLKLKGDRVLLLEELDVSGVNHPKGEILRRKIFSKAERYIYVALEPNDPIYRLELDAKGQPIATWASILQHEFKSNPMAFLYRLGASGSLSEILARRTQLVWVAEMTNDPNIIKVLGRDGDHVRYDIDVDISKKYAIVSGEVRNGKDDVITSVENNLVSGSEGGVYSTFTKYRDNSGILELHIERIRSSVSSDEEFEFAAVRELHGGESVSVIGIATDGTSEVIPELSDAEALERRKSEPTAENLPSRARGHYLHVRNHFASRLQPISML